MKKSCLNCDHWKNQNGPLFDANIAGERVGACFKLQRSIAVLHSMSSTHTGRTIASFTRPNVALYTTESFCCIDHTEKILYLTRNK